MLRDAEVVSDNKEDDLAHITKKRADLIFCQINKHKVNMTFETFLQTLIKIGECLYGNLTPSNALQKLVRIHFLPLHDKISNNSQLNIGH